MYCNEVSKFVTEINAEKTEFTVTASILPPVELHNEWVSKSTCSSSAKLISFLMIEINDLVNEIPDFGLISTFIQHYVHVVSIRYPLLY
jgi:hypothetical protein